MADKQMLDKDQQRIKVALSHLGEFFDSVQIFAQKRNEDENGKDITSYQDGTGNRYAIYGQVKEFVLCEEVRMRSADLENSDDEEDGHGEF